MKSSTPLKMQFALIALSIATLLSHSSMSLAEIELNHVDWLNEIKDPKCKDRVKHIKQDIGYIQYRDVVTKLFSRTYLELPEQDLYAIMDFANYSSSDSQAERKLKLIKAQTAILNFETKFKAIIADEINTITLALSQSIDSTNRLAFLQSISVEDVNLNGIYLNSTLVESGRSAENQRLSNAFFRPLQINFSWAHGGRQTFEAEINAINSIDCMNEKGTVSIVRNSVENEEIFNKAVGARLKKIQDQIKRHGSPTVVTPINTTNSAE